LIYILHQARGSIGVMWRCMMMQRIEVRKAWRFSGKHRVLRLDPEWLGGSEYVIVEKLPDGALLLRPALGVRNDGEAARLENTEVAMRDA
jgi:hypothetical protein